jgi:integrase
MAAWRRRIGRTARRPAVSAAVSHPLVVAHYVTQAAAEQTGVGKWRYAPATLTRWVSTINQRCTHRRRPRPELGGHSPRAGFVTEAFRAGADAHSIMRQTGHRSPVMLEVYPPGNAPLVGNAVTRIGF